MKQQLSIEEIIQVEQKCRKLHSEAVFDAIASLFKYGARAASRLAEADRDAACRLQGNRPINPLYRAQPR